MEKSRDGLITFLYQKRLEQKTDVDNIENEAFGMKIRNKK